LSAIRNGAMGVVQEGLVSAWASMDMQNRRKKTWEMKARIVLVYQIGLRLAFPSGDGESETTKS